MAQAKVGDANLTYNNTTEWPIHKSTTKSRIHKGREILALSIPNDIFSQTDEGIF
jgi:hypothetical protein